MAIFQDILGTKLPLSWGVAIDPEIDFKEQRLQLP
jgi:hypothetical protein